MLIDGTLLCITYGVLGIDVTCTNSNRGFPQVYPSFYF